MWIKVGFFFVWFVLRFCTWISVVPTHLLKMFSLSHQILLASLKNQLVIHMSVDCNYFLNDRFYFKFAMKESAFASSCRPCL